jgi:hypothetical protein
MARRSIRRAFSRSTAAQRRFNLKTAVRTLTKGNKENEGKRMRL